MNTCKNCKFWERDKPYSGENYGNNLEGMCECKNPKLDNAPGGNIVSTEDAPTEGFMTAPDFGCIHFEDEGVVYTQQVLAEIMSFSKERMKALSQEQRLELLRLLKKYFAVEMILFRENKIKS